MTGLVQGAMAPSAAPAQPTQFPTGAEEMGSTLKNPQLNQIEAGVEQSLRPEDKRTYQAIVVASMKLAFDDKTHPMLIKGLKSSPDIAKNVSLICAGMLGTVWEQSKTDPNVFLPAAVPASITLMCNIFEFAEQAGMVQPDDKMLAECSSATVKAVFDKFGIDDDKIREAIKSGQEKGGQPGAAPPEADPMAAPPGGLNG